MRHTYTMGTGPMDVELTDSPRDTVINTRCEHIDNFKEWYDKIPEGKIAYHKLIIILTYQHVNCSSCQMDFAEQTPVTEVLYAGELSEKRLSRIYEDWV